MIFRNSMRNIFRAFGKTTLFTLLIFTTTLALSLGIGVWMSIEQFLDECDDFYTTIGLVEYIGTEYPDDTANDPAMVEAIQSFDPGIITNESGTLLWDETSRAMGYIDGFWRSDKFVPDRMMSVFVISSLTYDERHDHYRGVILEELYSLKGKANTLIYIDGDFGTFEEDHYYLVFGEIYEIGSPITNMGAATYDNALVSSTGIEIPRMVDITSEKEDESYRIPEDSVLNKVAESIRVTNNSILVSETNDLMSLLPFHQEELFFVEGRAFTDDEYTAEAQVIVIPDLMAARLGIGVGDTVDVSVAVSDQPGVYNSYWVDSGFSYGGTFEVVGITNTVLDKSWYVYIPKSDTVPNSPYPVGYTVGHTIIKNDDALALSARLDPLLDNRFQFTIYDQGYSNVAIPFMTILSVAKIVTVVCVLVELAVIVLFGFLFVYRQRETGETMLFLGTGRQRVIGHFLFGAGLISLIATSMGAVVGYLLHDGINALVSLAAENYELIDSRFSNGNLSISRTLAFDPHLELHFFLYIGAAAFTLAMIACLFFVIYTFRIRKQNQRSSIGPTKGRRSVLASGSFKYALLSIIRGGARSAVVPVFSLVVVIFFGQLATTSQRYEEQLNSIYKNNQIHGSYMDIRGKQIGNLVLSAYDIANLFHSGTIDKLTVTKSEPYKYLGISFDSEGTDLDLPPFFVPSGSFSAESAEASILRGPDLTATNDIYSSPEFLYSDTVLMNFLDGYDETFLMVPSTDGRISSCLVPTSLMEAMEIRFGDTIRVAVSKRMVSQEYDRARIFQHYDLLVVGSYEKQGAEDTIYVPLSLFFDTSLVWEEGQTSQGLPTQTFTTGYLISDTQKEMLLSTTLNSAYFTLTNTHSLVEFKDYLTDYGYSQVNQVGKIREFIVLRDAIFNHSVASVKKQIQYINTLYPFLYTLVGVAALVLSYLLVVSRKVDCAIMRGLGTTRIRTFFNLFIEQSILCILGIVIGFIIWFGVWGAPVSFHIILTAGFLLCYLLGSAVSVTIMNHTNVLTILTDRE